MYVPGACLKKGVLKKNYYYYLKTLMQQVVSTEREEGRGGGVVVVGGGGCFGKMTITATDSGAQNSRKTPSSFHSQITFTSSNCCIIIIKSNLMSNALHFTTLPPKQNASTQHTFKEQTKHIIKNNICTSTWLPGSSHNLTQPTHTLGSLLKWNMNRHLAHTHMLCMWTSPLNANYFLPWKHAGSKETKWTY